MPTTNYERGRAYEYKIKKQLEGEGWTVVRTAGSHGPFDLISIKITGDTPYCERCQCNYQDTYLPTRQIRLIQCKSGKTKKGAIKKVKKSDIKKFEGLYSVSVEVV